MSLNIKRIQLTENGVTQDVDILTSAECVTFEDGDTLQAKLDNGDLASSDVLGDVDSLNGNVVDSLNELNDSAKETSELVSELANRGGVTSALRKEVANGTWEAIGNLPYEFWEGGAVVYNGEVHVLGSGSSSATQINHYKWNGSVWESVSKLPYSFYQGGTVIFDNEIHMIGGNGNLTKHYKYNGTTWESVSTLPFDFYRGCVVVYNNEIHAICSYQRIYHYKYNGSSWVQVGTLSFDVGDGDAVVYNNEIHIMGSYTNSAYYMHTVWNGSSYNYNQDLPYPFCFGSAVVLNNEIHIMGTGLSDSYDTAHYKYNGTNWESVSTLLNTFYDGDAVVYNNQIHIFGGQGSNLGHYSIKLGTFLNGYSKADTEIYLPISTTPCTSNLTATEDGYTVTQDGYVEILLNE